MRRALFAACALATRCATAAPDATLLDDFHNAALWQAQASDQVHAKLSSDAHALCLDYDFGNVSGYASMRRELPLTFPPNFEFAFDVRGSGPANAFEFKLIDASGDNVWWVRKPVGSPGTELEFAL